ncbi:MAG: oxidoreductase [Solirubrobacteraceae bacterium]|nr:oxidoreductase [Solirubrobacteraceae bacterium]
MTEPVRPPSPSTWQVAEVVAAWPEAAAARTLRFHLPEPMVFLPGQHFDVRLTAPDGYQAERSYSAASAPDPTGTAIELTIQRLADGEVSPYLCDVVDAGDQVELRGPIGGYFVWRGQAPVLLIGGGSGFVPLMSILRHIRSTAPDTPVRALVSVRTPADLLYAGELGDDVNLRYTRAAPPGWPEAPRRIASEDIADAAFDEGPAFICGPTGFVDHVADLLLEAGYPPERILTERFGPT